MPGYRESDKSAEKRNIREGFFMKFRTKKERAERQKFYNHVHWRKLTQVVREAEPLCRMCYEKGILKRSQCVDHIKPWKTEKDFWDTNNLQAICFDCHRGKTYDDVIELEKEKQTTMRSFKI